MTLESRTIERKGKVKTAVERIRTVEELSQFISHEMASREFPEDLADLSSPQLSPIPLGVLRLMNQGLHHEHSELVHKIGAIMYTHMLETGETFHVQLDEKYYPPINKADFNSDLDELVSMTGGAE